MGSLGSGRGAGRAPTATACGLDVKGWFAWGVTDAQ
jgi:hypothetical protein